MLKNRKNNLDEMQEQKALKIEHNGCWLAFWGLLIAIIVQIIFSKDLTRVAGEGIVFMVLSLYIMIDCLRNGIWDRKLKPDGKTNLLASLIAGGADLVICFSAAFFRTGKPYGALIAGVISGVIVFAGCFLCLTLATKRVKKKQRELEEEPAEEDEET